MNWTGKNIVLGVTGGIAAYKSAEVVSRLRHLGACVHVIMTKNATEFVAPLTFQTLSANAVATDTFPRRNTGTWSTWRWPNWRTCL
jgi:phosphopantothenoylcysteine decarboxylase/phosphopantothenate--cysteine ligase